MWEEHKDELIKPLTDEAIQDSVENIIKDYTFREGYFAWQWQEGIVNVIIKNYEKIINHPELNCKMLKKIKTLNEVVNRLETQIKGENYED